MNRIYSLRYSAVARGFVAVSEFARKCTSRVTGKTHIKVAVLLSPLFLSFSVGASILSAEIDYQIFRDFAENKGIFRPGATDITIYNKQGELIGTLNKASMPDFSSVNVKSAPGVATLINPQYIASVKHNGGYKSVRFGDGENLYSIVDRNNSSSVDFHAPRLDKLVTEVAPATVTSSSQSEILDSSKFSTFYRLGSGTQYIQDAEGNMTQVSGAYGYLTGGLLPALFHSHGGTTGIQVFMGGNINDRGVMASFGQAGDSG
ncbi:TPA: S6 family peptidase, partial [Escherichia coli]|nr:autotransporter outer membrane beta-barrel domain-containing protein [Escherichia coli]HCU6161786.1 autotransporter outer membrane beta-barrel domain-containing protein [Escherichia coli]